MKSPLKKSIGEVVTDYGTKVMRILKKRLQRSLFDFYGDVKADNLRTRETINPPTTPVDGDGGVIYTKAADGKLYYKSNEVAEVELSASDTVLTTEQVQDIAGPLVATGGTKTGITITYDDANNDMDFVVDHNAATNYVANEHLRWDTDVASTATIHTNNITDLHGAGVNGAANQVLTDNADGTVTSEAGLKWDGNILLVSSSTSARPMLSLNSDNTDAEAPELHLYKNSTGTDGDDLGKIRFAGMDSDANEHDFALILGEIVESNTGDEEGKLTLSVASHDGEVQPGLIIQSGDAEDEVDVTIGNTTTSLTTIAGDLAIDGGNITTAVEVDGLLTAGANIRVGGSGRTSNNWITIDAQSGNDSSGGGVVFYETQTDTLGSPQYGAKIVYNETADEFAIGTMQNNVFMRQIYMPRTSDIVYLADGVIIQGTTPVIQLLDSSTTVSDGDEVGALAWKNEDDDSTTLKIVGVATEDHASNSAGGSKFQFYVTSNTTSALALAATIDQNKDLQIEGDLQVTGNDIKDSGGSAAITFNGSGAVSIPAGDLTVSNHATVSKTLTVGGAGANPSVGIRTAKVTLSTADCNTLHTTPVTLVSAAGANTVIIPVTGMIRVDRAATQTNSSVDLNFHYDGTSGAFLNSSLVHLRRFMWNETGDRVFNIAPQAIERSQSLTEDVNAALVVSVDSALTNNCFTSVTIFLTYHVFDIS